MTTVRDAVDAILPTGKAGRGEYPWCVLSGVRYHLWRAYRDPMYIVNVVNLNGRPATYDKGQEKWLCKYEPDTKFKLYDDGRVMAVDDTRSNRREKGEEYSDQHAAYSAMLLMHLGVC